MFARFLAYAALCACVLSTSRTQPSAAIYVNVSSNSSEVDDVEKRYTPELLEELSHVKDDALLMYTEYTGEAGSDLKYFIKNISLLSADTLKTIDGRLLANAPAVCREQFARDLKKIEYDVHRAASFSGENHHKYFLGHMVVFRMHLNKSEDFIKKCESLIKTCGLPCETTPRITRWRRFALNELNRAKEDLLHSRRSYRDLLLHSRRRLNHLKKQASDRSKIAVRNLEKCSQSG